MLYPLPSYLFTTSLVLILKLPYCLTIATSLTKMMMSNSVDSVTRVGVGVEMKVKVGRCHL